MPYNKLLTNLACSSRTGEYWPLVVFARTSRCFVRTVTTSGQYSPVRPSRSVSKRLILPVRPRAQFLWKTIREKVPYEGRTCRSDRAGKTRTALLEKRAALLETPTAKSMWVNDRNNFVAAKVCSLQNESWQWTFWERILLSRRIVRYRTTREIKHDVYGKRQTSKMKLLPSVFSSLYSRIKIFVFAVNSKRHFSIFVWFI